jgi:hypothetical protein
MNHLLIKYIFREDNHVDPNFTYLTYGDSGNKGTQIQKTLIPGSYVIFHTSFDGKAYITGYFYVEKILSKDEHLSEIAKLSTHSKYDDVIILGNRERSKILTYPLRFDKALVVKLKSLNIDKYRFNDHTSELATISSATRSHRKLSNQDVELLIEKCMYRG